MESIELFTGGGGLALGSHRAGFRHLALAEWNGDACRTVRLNLERSRAGRIHSMAPIDDWQIHESDIRAMLKSGFFRPYKDRLDLLAGGVPCQPFSLGGKARANADSRDMFPDFVEVVRQTRPRAFVVENVKGLLRESFSTYFSYILLRLEYPEVTARADETWQDHLRRLETLKTSGASAGLSYRVVFELLNAANYGVPQTRERVFFVGFRSDLGIDWHFPRPTHSKERLAFEQYVSGCYWERHGVKPPYNAASWVGPRMLESVRSHAPLTTEPWRTIRDAIGDLPEPRVSGSPEWANHVLQPGARAYPGHTGSPIDQPSKTLKAGVHGVPGGENTVVLANGTIRYLTVREAARVQTFPDDWIFEGAWSEAMRQIGNAVPMALAEVVARSVRDRLTWSASCQRPSSTLSITTT